LENSSKNSELASKSVMKKL